MSGPQPDWRTVEVGGRGVRLMDAGAGEPLLFLHGWGLTPRIYTRALAHLYGEGIRVIAPALPGYAGSEPPPREGFNLDWYAAHIEALLEVVGITTPVLLAGHSLGGGIGIRFATNHPEWVRSLTLVDPVGGAPSKFGRRSGDEVMTHRAWWHWAAGAVREADPRLLPRLIPGLLRDFVPSAVRRPVSMAMSGFTALTADLAEEARALVESGLAVIFVWGDQDRLVLPGAFAAIESEIPANIVRGRHGWLLSDPEQFGSVLHDALLVHGMLESEQRGRLVVVDEATRLAAVLPHERRGRARKPPATPDGGAE
ncbi:MAG: alpha/beta fold hydrolase [Pseudonocardiales bacterium]